MIWRTRMQAIERGTSRSNPSTPSRPWAACYTVLGTRLDLRLGYLELLLIVDGDADARPGWEPATDFYPNVECPATRALLHNRAGPQPCPRECAGLGR